MHAQQLWLNRPWNDLIPELTSSTYTHTSIADNQEREVTAPPVAMLVYLP